MRDLVLSDTFRTQMASAPTMKRMITNSKRESFCSLTDGRYHGRIFLRRFRFDDDGLAASKPALLVEKFSVFHPDIFEMTARGGGYIIVGKANAQGHIFVLLK